VELIKRKWRSIDSSWIRNGRHGSRVGGLGRRKKVVVAVDRRRVRRSEGIDDGEKRIKREKRAVARKKDGTSTTIRVNPRIQEEIRMLSPATTMTITITTTTSTRTTTTTTTTRMMNRLVKVVEKIVIGNDAKRAVVGNILPLIDRPNDPVARKRNERKKADRKRIRGDPIRMMINTN
jgi:hypothetical protein